MPSSAHQELGRSGSRLFLNLESCFWGVFRGFQVSGQRSQSQIAQWLNPAGLVLNIWPCWATNLGSKRSSQPLSVTWWDSKRLWVGPPRVCAKHMPLSLCFLPCSRGFVSLLGDTPGDPGVKWRWKEVQKENLPELSSWEGTIAFI